MAETKNVLEVTDSSFEQEVLQSEQPVVVDFWAPWCGPCNQFAPVFENLANEYEGKAKFVKVNVDENQQYAQKYGVMSIPTIVVFNNGEVYWEPIVGAQAEAIREKLDSIVS